MSLRGDHMRRSRWCPWGPCAGGCPEFFQCVYLLYMCYIVCIYGNFPFVPVGLYSQMVHGGPPVTTLFWLWRSGPRALYSDWPVASKFVFGPVGSWYMWLAPGQNKVCSLRCLRFIKACPSAACLTTGHLPLRGSRPDRAQKHVFYCKFVLLSDPIKYTIMQFHCKGTKRSVSRRRDSTF